MTTTALNRVGSLPLEGVTLEDLVDEYHRLIEGKLERIADGSGARRGEGTEAGWISGLSMVRLVTPDEWRLTPLLTTAVAHLSIRRDLRHVHQVMVNVLDPGTALDTHRDGPLAVERWHLPIITEHGVEYWEEKLDGPAHFEAGRWHGPIGFTSLHSMRNNSNVRRVHVVVDLELSDGRVG